MTCWTSSSSSRSRLAVLLGAVVLGDAVLAGCAAARLVPAPDRPSRIALLPPENLADAQAPLAELGGWTEAALARAGIEVVSGDLVERFAVKRRIRYLGGLDRATALAAAEELGVDGVLITSLTQHDASDPPRFGLVARLVSTTERPDVFWIDGASAAGDDAPGLMGLGLVHRLEPLARGVLARLSGSLASFLEGRTGRSQPCPSQGRFQPRTVYRAAVATEGKPATVAVLPFQNSSHRSRAGEIVALEVVRQLSAVKRFTVLEPGLVRENLLRYRIVTEGGVSLENARAALATMEADYVLAGTVRQYEEGRGDGATPQADFTVIMIDTHTNETVWHSTSTGTGIDGVHFFGLGRVSTGTELTCRLVRGVVDRMAEAPEARRPTFIEQLTR